MSPGHFTLISARGSRAGKFSKERLKGFGRKLKASIRYRGRRVILVVQPK